MVPGFSDPPVGCSCVAVAVRSTGGARYIVTIWKPTNRQIWFSFKWFFQLYPCCFLLICFNLIDKYISLIKEILFCLCMTISPHKSSWTENTAQKKVNRMMNTSPTCSMCRSFILPLKAFCVTSAVPLPLLQFRKNPNPLDDVVPALVDWNKEQHLNHCAIFRKTKVMKPTLVPLFEACDIIEISDRTWNVSNLY